MPDIKFEIKETVGMLSEGSNGWNKELNLISWNDKEPKYDIRDWDVEHKKMSKGITLSLEELKVLRNILYRMDLDTKLDINYGYKAMRKIVLADVLYTNSDETFYVLSGKSRYLEKYISGSMHDSIILLEEDSWMRCGKVQRNDNSLADMLVRNNEYIAIWEE